MDTTVPVKGAKEADTANLLENTYRHLNLALVNEMVSFCRELDIDLWEVIGAASTKPFGFQPFYPGPGVSGRCIPIDPDYLSYAIRGQFGRPLRFKPNITDQRESPAKPHVTARIASTTPTNLSHGRSRGSTPGESPCAPLPSGYGAES